VAARLATEHQQWHLSDITCRGVTSAPFFRPALQVAAEPPASSNALSCAIWLRPLSALALALFPPFAPGQSISSLGNSSKKRLGVVSMVSPPRRRRRA